MNRFEFLKKIKLPKFGRPSVRQGIFWGAALVISIITFIVVRSLTTCFTVADLPGISPASCAGGGEGTSEFIENPEGTPIAQVPPTPVLIPEAALPPAWDGASRINILFIGLDARDIGQVGPPRSDTLMLITIDPISKSAGMLSIPRDMWVNIPGFGYSRINTAYASGVGSQLPGGGPGLAMKTVSQFIGVPVDYYVQVDFNVFIELVENLIDTAGCIEVYPTEQMILDPIGGGTDHVKLTTGGIRELCKGWIVLAYARNRHTSGGDFDRAKRQQEVILALQKKVFDPSVFPALIAQAPQMYQQFSYGIKTNMTIEDAIKLAVLGKDISRESIKTGVIDTTMVTFDNTVLGGEDASVMKPIADKIRILRDEIFTTGGALSPIAVPLGQTDINLITQAMRGEEARVRIVDGTFTPGLDQRAGQFFQSQGMNVTEVGAADQAYGTTIIVVYGPKLYTIRYLQTLYGITHSNIRFNPDPNSSVDIEIRLGSDIAGSIP